MPKSKGAKQTSENNVIEVPSTNTEPVITPCKVCKTDIKDSDKSLKCNTCLKWVCLPCSKIEETTYEILTALNIEGITYTCPKC